MHRLLQQRQINSTLEELHGKQHWWWDTSADNDGGALNDPKVRLCPAWSGLPSRALWALHVYIEFGWFCASVQLLLLRRRNAVTLCVFPSLSLRMLCTQH